MEACLKALLLEVEVARAEHIVLVQGVVFWFWGFGEQGYLARKRPPPPLGPP